MLYLFLVFRFFGFASEELDLVRQRSSRILLPEIDAKKDPAHVRRVFNPPLSVDQTKQEGIPWLRSEIESIKYAKKCHKMFKGKVDPRYALIINYDRDSDYPRMHLMDIKSYPPKIILRSHAGHGKGNINKQLLGLSSNPPRANALYDTPGSEAVSPGCMVAKPSKHKNGAVMTPNADPGVAIGVPDYPGFHLHALDYMNQCVYARGQKLHRSPNIINNKAVAGASHGCTNLLGSDYEFLKKYVTKKGLLMLNYTSKLPAPRKKPRRNKDVNCYDQSGKSDRRRKITIAPEIRIAPPESWNGPANEHVDIMMEVYGDN